MDSPNNVEQAAALQQGEGAQQAEGSIEQTYKLKIDEVLTKSLRATKEGVALDINKASEQLQLLKQATPDPVLIEKLDAVDHFLKTKPPHELVSQKARDAIIDQAFKLQFLPEHIPNLEGVVATLSSAAKVDLTGKKVTPVERNQKSKQSDNDQNKSLLKKIGRFFSGKTR